MPQQSTGHVFISYSRKDEIVIRRIVMLLRNQGIKAWVDNENLAPGTPVWEEEIAMAIMNAFAIVAVLSPDAKRSEWVHREVTYADQYEKRVFPVLVSGDEDSSIPIRLITRQFVDIRSKEEVGLNSLSAAIAFYAEGIEAREEKAREEAEKLANAQAEREAAERESARLKAELEAAELAVRQAAEKAAKEKAEEELARENAAHEKAAREKAEQEKVERKVIKKLEHGAKEKETRLRAEKRRKRYLELLNKTTLPIKLHYRRIFLIVIAVTLIVWGGKVVPSLLPLISTSTSQPTATSLLRSILSSSPGPTKTRIPTAVPTLTITPLPISMTLYDDFNKKAYDGNYDKGKFDSKKWAYSQDPGLTLIQQDGVLKLAAETGDCGRGCEGGITIVGDSTNVAERPLSLTNVIETKMSLATEFSGSSFSVSLKVRADLPYHSAYFCSLLENSNELYFECTSDISPTHTSKRITVARNQYYTVRIEVDPSNVTFRTYLNNRLVDVFEPSNPNQLKNLKFIFSVLFGAGSNTSGSALVDDVRLGYPTSP